MSVPDEQPAADLVRTESATEGAPSWLAPMIRQAIWRLVWVVISLALLVVAVQRMHSLLVMLIVSAFFGIALEPAVNWLHVHRGWRRGSATGLLFVALGLGAVLLFAILIPGLVTAADLIRDQIPTWISSLNDRFGLSIPEAGGSDAASQVNDQVKSWLRDHGSDLLGLAGTAIGLVFQGATVAMFTFYFAADAPRIRHAVLRRLTPERQQRLGWAWDTAIQQTGGYFYSRMLLMVINGGLFFFAMLLVGMPWTLALAMSAFEGFVAEFIPAVGTYIGAAVPIVVTLGVQGFGAALALLIWTLIYQQVENYVLSPRLSARTMEINGGVAFGSALAGGALAGPMGAFMALPTAALVTSFTKHYARSYPLAYHSAYDDAEPEPDAEPGVEPEAERA